MDAIVLLKYVADIEHIPPDAWDLETGTLRRNRLQMVANPLDDRALAAARSLTSGSSGKLIVVSMGPRSAEAACRRALAYGADEAYLLSDAAFAGSDTLATARVLSAAIDRIARGLRSNGPVILAGMQSPDGDTAQVPAEVATMLGLPLLPYATRVDLQDDRLVVESLHRRGRHRVSIAPQPLVVTLTALAPPLPFATSLDRLRAGAAGAVERLRARELGIAPGSVGLEGSATRVERIESVPQREGGGTLVDLDEVADVAEAVGAVVHRVVEELLGPSPDSDDPHAARSRLRDAAEAGGSVDASVDGAAAAERRSGREIWTVVEREGGRFGAGGLELLGEARVLADELRCDVAAVVCEDDLRPDEAAELAARGATRVLVLTREAAAIGEAPGPAADATRGEALTPRDDDAPFGHAGAAALIAGAARELRPRTILIPATLRGRTVSAVAAALLDTGLTADCTGLELAPATGPSGDRGLLQTRPALGGNILATIVTTARDEGRPEMATVRSGVFAEREYPVSAARAPRAERYAVAADALREFVPRPGTFDPLDADEREAGGSAGRADAGVDVNADVIVAVGAGVGSAENVDAHVRPLIAAMSAALGLVVSLACSRAAVDAGILPYEYQIGQTGKSVRPRLYVALGISGAIQHRLGMEHAARVLSVNPDPDAPIHSVSDWSIVATIEDAVPALRAALAGPAGPA